MLCSADTDCFQEGDDRVEDGRVKARADLIHAQDALVADQHLAARDALPLAARDAAHLRVLARATTAHTAGIVRLCG